ncbi:unnamed protein product [Rotaria socialis]|uniref:Enkurin domain-containing protein n=1 Tax=Rotaria socialis TaxID=392032 RepID=A0A818FC64_9BILA|nr:unnamed protein product [Rotaria socialis]CAF3329916.1 unnamed protein product [Rotaria socialis]CAF3374590.1 unnamed protein product [Rotaria socialis]CAF3413739.1 unnamed protein product [Rotaria socialis]CAF3473031.1 unnamed protein product [Rotaria socialis]
MVVGQNNKNQQEESVYNLIPRNEIRPPKASCYVSKFNPDVREKFNEGKHEHRTMGYAEEPVPGPQQFLKKNQNNTKHNVINNNKDTSLNKDRTQRKPPVPSIRDAPKMGTRTEKNFIQTNSLDVVMTVPKKPERNTVDDRFGDKFPVDQSGLTQKYVLKKNFGEVPVYIKTRQADMEKAKQEYQTYVSDYFRRGAMREMDIEERKTIVDGLKKQWEDVHHEYQTLSVLIDTIPKRQYKERLEHQMKLLEKDIDLLEKHHVIYIAD